MPKSQDPFPYYAVQNGREGPRIYTSREECEKNTRGIPDIKIGRFHSLVLAQRYIAPALARATRLQAIRLALKQDVGVENAEIQPPMFELCVHEVSENLEVPTTVDVEVDMKEEYKAQIKEVEVDSEDYFWKCVEEEVMAETTNDEVVVDVKEHVEANGMEEPQTEPKEGAVVGVKGEDGVDVKAELVATMKEEVMADITDDIVANVDQAVNPGVGAVSEPNKADGIVLREELVFQEGHGMYCCPVPTSQAKKDAPNAPGTVILSDEQLHILDLVRQGKNVFFTGSAGTGKSVLVRAIIGLWPPGCRRLAITASTGAASVHFPGGRTVHSWAGIGLGTKDADLLVEEIKCNNHKKRMWQQTRCILIDEISMIDDELFDKLDYIGRRIRENSRPFGGIQLVVCGDFFQLPPVVNASKIKAKFAFESRAWNECFDKTHRLTHVFRQSDADFVKMLEEVKIGKVSAKTEAEFKYLARPVKYYDDIGPVELYPTNEEATMVNQMYLDCIDDLQMVYSSHDVAGVDVNDQRISERRFQQVLKSISAPEEVVVKKGARVMLIMNRVQGVLVNGSVGVVEDFLTIQEAEGAHMAPFDALDPEALERVKDNLPTIVRDPRSKWMGYRYPVVRFMDGQSLLCAPVQFKQENRLGHMMASRTQVPLILSWALSIHKSQGATLERVKVDLSRVFERGQAYVALSRATSMDTLQVLNFDKSRVEAHPHVLKWMGYDADEHDLEDENYRRAWAEEEYKRAHEKPKDEEDYFAYVDDIDDIDVYLMDCEDSPM